VITDLAVFSRATRRDKFQLIETAPGISRADVRRCTVAEYLD